MSKDSRKFYVYVILVCMNSINHLYMTIQESSNLSPILIYFSIFSDILCLPTKNLVSPSTSLVLMCGLVKLETRITIFMYMIRPALSALKTLRIVIIWKGTWKVLTLRIQLRSNVINAMLHLLLLVHYGITFAYRVRGLSGQRKKIILRWVIKSIVPNVKSR